MSSKSRFWDMIAKRYAKSPVADEAAYQKKLSITQEYLRPDMHVLEFGCGTGSTAIQHAPYVKRILAIDISNKMLNIAKARAQESGISNIDFEQGDIDALYETDRTYDVVMGMSVLHLLQDHDAALKTVHSLLKPGGIFISSTACLGGMSGIAKIALPIGHFLRLLPFVSFFSEDELLASLTNAGFQIEQQWQPAPGQALFIVATKADF